MFSSKDLRDYLGAYQRVWSYIESLGTRDAAVQGIARKRVYFDDRMMASLDQAGIVYFDPNLIDTDRVEYLSDGRDLGLFSDTKNGRLFFLSGRYVLPIRDMSGNVIALVGWLDDGKKYLTTGSEYFSKSTLFYGMERIPEGGPSFIVEGIFDRLAIQAAGYRAFATMGISTDKRKQVLYNLMGRVVGIPDSDREGRKVVENDSWGLPTGSSYFRWHGEYDFGGDIGSKPIKDIDMFIKSFGTDYAHSLLMDVYKSADSRVIKLDLTV